MRTFLLALTLVLPLGCATQPVHPDRGKSLDALLTRYETYGFSGTVLVAKDDKVILHKGYGLADRERGIRNDTNTRFEVASLVKTFVSAATLQLEERGALATSDPLSRHLGDFPPAKSAATVHHLATHTGGLVLEGVDLDYGTDRARFLDSVKRVAADSVPGERYRYSNAGFSTLAALVETVSGQTLEAYAREHLFKPAGLKDTYFRGEVGADPRLARGYVGTPAKIEVSTPPPYQWGVRGSGGLIMTVEDLYRWHRALHQGRVLSPQQKEKMFHPWPTEGYGWHVGKDESGRRLIRKGGGMPEYATQVLFYPDERLVIVWASNNLQQRWRQALNRAIPATLIGTEAVVPPKPINVSLEMYTGRYVTSSGLTFDLTMTDGYLYVTGDEKSLPVQLRFLPTGKHSFTGFDPTRVVRTEMSFEIDAEGNIGSVTIGELTARRKP